MKKRKVLSVCAKDNNNANWIVTEYNLNFIQFIKIGLRCYRMFDIVEMKKVTL